MSFISGTINKARSCEEALPNQELNPTNHSNFEGLKNLKLQDKAEHSPGHHELITSKSLDNILDYQMSSGNAIHAQSQHRSSFLDNKPNNFESPVSSSDSLNDKNYQIEFSDEENLPGARKRYNRRLITENSDDLSEKSVSLMHSCSDLDSYCSEDEEGDDIENSYDSAVINVLDGVAELHVSAKEDNSLPRDDAVTLDVDVDVDADQDKTNPAYIPRAGRYYMHDHRTLEEDVVVVKKQESSRRWKHDKFNYYEQAPRSTEEIIWRYGYDIRKENLCPFPSKIKPCSGGNIPTKPLISAKNNEAYYSPSQSNKETDTKTRSNLSCGDQRQRSPPETQAKITYPSGRYNNYGRFTRSDRRARNLSTRKDLVADELQTLRHSRILKEDSVSGTNVRHSHPTQTVDISPVCPTDTHDSSHKPQQGLNYSNHTSSSNLSRRNRGDLSKPSVTNFERVHRKQTVNVVPVNTKDGRVYKPRAINHSSHTHEQVKCERAPKRYSTVRQNVSNIDPSVDKKVSSLQLLSPVRTKELCDPVKVKDLKVTKESTSGDAHEVVQLPKPPTDYKGEIANNNQVCTETTSIGSFNQQEVNPQSVNLTMHSVPVTHFQPSIEYNTRIPAEFSSVNAHLQTIYFPNIFQHNPRCQPPSNVMSSFVPPNAHQAPMHRLYGNEIQNVDLSIPVATTLCFDHMPCGATNDPSRTYVMHLGVAAMEPLWNGEEKPVLNRKFSKKPLEVIDPRDGTRVNKVALSET
ncbi:unnamed protein product [Schistosoma turkestanicum]|nr:unnamed protein product [Schistosoma turkestanicum]